MKTQSVALAAARAAGTTAFAWCWKVTRADGEIFGFTSSDVALTISGVTYQAATGITPSAIQGRADLSVANLEVSGALDADTITEDDLRAGVWDGAVVEIFEVNARDLTQGRMLLPGGRIGNVRAGRSGWWAELRGLAQGLQQPIGEVYTAGCTALLGDSRCGVDVEATRTAFTVTAVTDAIRFVASGLIDLADYFGGGELTWTGGANDGRSMEIRDFASGGQFTLQLPMPAAVQVGDTFTAVAGCRKRAFEDCQAKFDNVVNFRGFPHVPGNAKVIGNAGLEASDAA